MNKCQEIKNSHNKHNSFNLRKKKTHSNREMKKGPIRGNTTSNRTKRTIRSVEMALFSYVRSTAPDMR